MFKYCDGPQGKQAVEHYRKHKLLERGEKTTSFKQKISQSGFSGYRLLYRTGSVRDISHLMGHVREGKRGVLILMDSNHLCKTF